MKKILYFSLLILAVVSCKKNDKIKEEAEEKPLNVEIVRYDKVFFETKPQDFPKLKAQYPQFFPESMTPQQEQALFESVSDPMWRKLYNQVEKRYDNFDKQKEEIEKLFKYVQFYYPSTKVPKIYTMINNADPEQKVIYDRDKNVLLISLEMYLGKDSWVYEYPEYLKKTFEEGQMLPDIVDQLSFGKIKPPTERDFLSQIIFAGKQMYMKDIFLPEVTDEDKICYTAEEIKWCEENDVEVWKYFVEQNFLYSPDQKLIQNFIAPGPFSKFGMDNDKDTPSRIGVWLGWQIVRSFMENNDIPVQQMMVLDAKEIFQKSKYKPAK